MPGHARAPAGGAGPPSAHALLAHIPSGTSLPPGAWARRHRGILVMLYAHAPALAVFGILMGKAVLHALLEGSIVVLFAAIASAPRLAPRARTIAAALGIMSSSAILVHLSGGFIEAHFHFFVMLGVIFLYEDWLPYTLSVAYVAIHHGIAGTLDPTSVYNHPSAIAYPWTWAGVHALFVMGLSAALIVAWGIVDRARRDHADALAETQRLRRQLHAQEKLAALGSLVSGLAHEVRTPLTAVTTNAALIDFHARRVAAKPEDAERLAMHVREIHAGVDRVNALVLQLRRFHRLEAEARVVASLDGLVREAMALWTSAHKTGARVRLDLHPTTPTAVEPLGVQQVVINLVSNAVEACDPTTGEVTVRTFDEEGHACLVVEDDGRGMDDQTQARLFEPLFTTKPEGTGLGLHIVKRIVESHGGRISCESAPGRGSRFRVHFGPPTPNAPRAAEAASSAPAA